MKEYIIYSRMYTEDGGSFILYASDDYEYGTNFIKREDEKYHKITKFPTVNSAIIWWRAYMEWIYSEYGAWATLYKYSKNPIVDVGEIINGDVSKPLAVHRLMLCDSPLNKPDPKTMTEEEKEEYKRIIEHERVIKGAIESITREARIANALEEKKKKRTRKN